MSQFAREHPELADHGIDYRDHHADRWDLRDKTDPDPYDLKREAQEDRDRAAEAMEERNQ